ncbi:MAG TPA: NAD(P)-binding domain-containing protein [Thermohalobaculum sp.]|nr:NAD(P)-binding domain-containing protein [Thermohalobaculum sp.]
MRETDVIIIGAGQAGLAMSRVLSQRGIDHRVLERGRVAERWRSERWDSLRLLTPNWCTRLPGWRYRGGDPDGFMTMPEVVRFFADYAHAFCAPVLTGVTVRAVRFEGTGWRVETDREIWAARAVVIATGHCDRPRVPAMAGALPRGIRQLTPPEYRNARALPEGGVLVVGASASGVQLAAEIHASGRPVTLAVGRHIRLPRRYRGRDIIWWLDRTGLLDERIDRVPDPDAARAQPSLQLVGDPAGRALDLAVLARAGVRLVGRAQGVDGARMRFAGDLAETTAAAERKLTRLRARIDRFAALSGLGAEVGPPDPDAPVLLDSRPQAIDLAAEGIRTLVWATGYRRDYAWLRVPALGPDGEIVQRGGVTAWPGLYVLGLRFQRRRKSSFIDGVGDDAMAIAPHLAAHLGAECRVAV